MMQPVVETEPRKVSLRKRGGLFAPPRVLPSHITESSADGLSSKPPSGQPTVIYGLPMSFRDRRILSDTESEYKQQSNNHSDLSQVDSLSNPGVSNCCVNAVNSTTCDDSTAVINTPERSHGMTPGEINDVFYQCSSNDVDLTDVTLRESTVKPIKVDLMNRLTSLSPYSLRRHCDIDNLVEINESNYLNTSDYLAKTCSKIGSLGECDVEHVDSCLSQLTVSLPNVEDGLSSGSELDAPDSDCLSPKAGKTKSLNSNPHLNTIMHASQSRSTTHSPPSSPIRPVSVNGSLVNPPLVQDIFGIMRDIKLALSEDGTVTTGSKKANDMSLARKDDHTPEDTQPTVDRSCSEFSSNANTSVKSITSMYGPDIPTTGNCSRITVRASIEHQVPTPISNELPPHGMTACSNRQTPPHGRQTASNPSYPDTNKYAHQWSFPQPSSAAYSSDEDIAPVKTATQRSARTGQRTRPSQAVPSARHRQYPSETMTSQPVDESEAEDTQKLLARNGKPDNPIFVPELKEAAARQVKRLQHVREVSIQHPDFPDRPIHGFLFHARYLGSTQLVTRRPPTRSSRMYQAKEALYRVKDPEGDHQPSVPIRLFISVERIMIMDHTLKEIIIDHGLRTISYIADMGDVLVLMSCAPSSSSTVPPSPSVDKGVDCDSSTTPSSGASTSSSTSERNLRTKLLCHVLESDEAQLVAQSVNHAFQLAYLDYLRESGVDDLTAVKHLRYEDALHGQEIFCDELATFCSKDKQKQVTITKQRGEPLGVVIVSSGWGSLVPTALLANMLPTGPAARCGQLNIGNRIIAVNGQSLVGLTLSESQSLVKACRGQTSVRLTIVDCPPVTEVFIRRPSVEHQLGFSVQDGVICSLLRGGIAERGGIRVDHRIIEINDESVVAMPHEYIVQLLTVVTGEIHIRTMPTAVFRLLTGQETPHYI